MMFDVAMGAYVSLVFGTTLAVLLVADYISHARAGARRALRNARDAAKNAQSAFDRLEPGDMLGPYRVASQYCPTCGNVLQLAAAQRAFDEAVAEFHRTRLR